MIVDKLPLFTLAITDAVATMLTHSGRPDPLTVPERLANAAVSCVAYLGQLFVPVGLSPFYSHPEAGWPTWQVASAVAVLLLITAAAVIGRRAYPYFFVGWFWYLGMLVPVLGLTYVGGTPARTATPTFRKSGCTSRWFGERCSLLRRGRLGGGCLASDRRFCWQP